MDPESPALALTIDLISLVDMVEDQKEMTDGKIKADQVLPPFKFKLVCQIVLQRTHEPEKGEIKDIHLVIGLPFPIHFLRKISQDLIAGFHPSVDSRRPLFHNSLSQKEFLPGQAGTVHVPGPV